MFINTNRKTKTEMARTGRRSFKEDESEKLEREVQRWKIVERNLEAGQNPPRVVAPIEEEEEDEEEEEEEEEEVPRLLTLVLERFRIKIHCSVALKPTESTHFIHCIRQ